MCDLSIACFQEPRRWSRVYSGILEGVVELYGAFKGGIWESYAWWHSLMEVRIGGLDFDTWSVFTLPVTEKGE